MKKLLLFPLLLIGKFCLAQNVGIGTTSPQKLLSVNGAMVVDQGNSNTGTSSTGALSFGSLSGEAIGSKRNSGTGQFGLDFYTNGINRMTVSNSGNVGINIINPSSKLEIRGALGFSSVSKRWEMSYDSTNGYFYMDEYGSARRFYIKDGGNVGIGVANPLTKLDVAGSIKIGNSNVTEPGSIRYNSGKFEGYNGVGWTSFDQLPTGTLVSSSYYPNTELVNKGFKFKGFLNNVILQKEITGIAANTWLPTSTQTIVDPGAITGHSIVWTGTEMIVWGGDVQLYPNHFTTYEGAKYNPNENTWVYISNSNAPTARSYHTAVWTGTEIIVWGGYSDSYTPLFTGGKYNPSTDSWTATTTTNAQPSRYAHTAIWTGAEMIVWGGYDGTAALNSGAKYNPTTNTWTAITTTNAPSGRYGHTAIWTGTEMIIWGGYNGSSRLNTGAKYNPTTNTWTTITTTNAPSARDSHTAVWSGTDMIIWGGYDGSAGVNSGAKYNAGTNTWVTIPSIPGTSGMVGHAACWTGTEMLIWGGSNANPPYQYYSNIFKYAPGSNSWTTITAANPPEEREYVTSVWTGNCFIVWGGNTFTSLHNTGGRFFPTALPSYTTSTDQSGPIYLFSKE